MTEAPYTFSDDLAGHCLALTCNFSNDDLATAMKVTFALRDAVFASTVTSQQTEVCRVQLAWWQEELNRVTKGEPRHPKARAFAKACHVGDGVDVLFREWVVAAERRLENATAKDETAYRISAYRDYGTTLQLALNPTTPAAIAIEQCSLRLAILQDWSEAHSRHEDSTSLLEVAYNSMQSKPSSEDPTLALLLHLCDSTIDRLHSKNKQPSALYLLWRAWRQARHIASNRTP